MKLRDTPRRFGEHRNSFGFLRLFFAALVIASHSPELIDGNRSREILSRLFGTLSFGEFAVDGFFVVSGYLILASYLRSATIGDYLLRRVARIYPAFLLASLVCYVVVAPLGGARIGALPPGFWLEAAARSLLLLRPDVPGAFAGTPYPEIDNAMWTINREFGCYLMVVLAGVCGLYRRPVVIVALAAVLLVAFVFVSKSYVRFPALFLAGGSFYLYRDHIPLTWTGAAVALAGLLAGLCSLHTATIAFATCGAYLIFWIASLQRPSWLTTINNRDDISYGVYLYAWPITKLVLWYRPATSPLEVGLVTLAGACLCGVASWHLLEKPVMRLVRGRAAAPPVTAPAA